MGTAISCTECSKVAGLIEKSVETPRKHRLFVQLFFVQLFFVQLSFVRRSYVAIDRHVLSTRACARAHTEALEVPEIVNKTQGKQCKANSACLRLCVHKCAKPSKLHVQAALNSSYGNAFSNNVFQAPPVLL